MDQIEQYSPPPNFTKLSDSRAQGYIAEYGNSSWELDALEPKVMISLIERSVNNYIDVGLWQEKEEQQRVELFQLL